MPRAALQTAIQTLLDHLVAEGNERGTQVAAYVDGKLVVNAWAGIADAESGRPVDPSTLFPVFSTTKGITATVLHQVIDRANISYDTPIADIWPEFAANGKAGVTIRNALNHQSGIPQMPRAITHADLADWDLICARIADLTPLWEPSTRSEYHALTYGWIIGEIARRIDGRPFPQLLAENIVAPLGVDSLYIGIPDSDQSRVATLENPGSVAIPDDGQPQAVPFWLRPLHEWMNQPESRRICSPASGGIANALSLARHYAALLPGGMDGIELLPPDRVRLATQPQKPDRPIDNDYYRGWGLGYQIGGETNPIYGGPTAFGHPGYGGSIAFADPEHRLAFAFTRNLFTTDHAPRVVDELRAARPTF